MGDERVVLRVAQGTANFVREYAEAKNISAGEAADRLISTAMSRLAALNKYGKKAPKSTPKKAPKRAKKTTVKTETTTQETKDEAAE